MARKDDTPAFRKHQKVVAARDLPGIPAGTPGKILLVNGLAWVRYRVLFDGGIERGMLEVDDLMTPEAWDGQRRAELAEQRRAERDARLAARARTEGSAA